MSCNRSNKPFELIYSPPSQSSTGSIYPLSNHVSYSRFSANHIALLSAISTHDEPTSFAQAVKFSHWREAMSSEIQALEQSNT